ncbi:MAG: OsmC family protein [Flavobacteriales bacterium]|nr:OsmC family protein [Flavobacteriales bacterium]
MDTSHITYLGSLRTEVTHVRSGQRFVTDAPVDNKGKGEAISPTDLLATSLAACMITTMDIVARDKGIELREVKARVLKHMASGPRRVQRVEVYLELDGSALGPAERELMEKTAHECPVALSLHPDLVQEMHFSYA